VTHWDRFYLSEIGALHPSQFAVFVMGELGDLVEGVIDVGCGNGRDTAFFASQGLSVLGIDRSQEAVDLASQFHPNVPFAVGSFGGLNLDDDLLMCVYGRFLLHAVSEEEEDRIIEGTVNAGAVLAVEFRTVQDQDGVRVTPDHYRRYVNPDMLAGKLEAAGMRVEYRIEGKGMAKFGADDAHVCRMIAAAPGRL